MTTVGYPQGAVRALLTALPELREVYESRRGTLGESDTDSSPYIVYAVLLNPHLWKLLESDGGDRELTRIFNFLEVLAGDSDYRVRTLLSINVLEPLAGEDIAKRGIAFMGPATRALFEGRERFVASAKQPNPLRQFHAWISALVETREFRIRRLLEELKAISEIEPEQLSADLQPAARELKKIEASLVSAAESYLSRRQLEAPAPVDAPPQILRAIEWRDEQSALAARALHHRWRRLAQLARALSP